jgi:hypothetical protein
MAPDLVSEFIRAFNDEVNRNRRDCNHRRDGLQREQKDLNAGLIPSWMPSPPVH